MAKKAAKKVGRGGARAGAGRHKKIEGRTKMVGVRLPEDVIEWMESTGLSQAAAITQAVRAFKAGETNGER